MSPGNAFEHKVGRFITDHRLLSHDALCLVALSGGADSVALLRVLLRLGYRIEAIHCNFHLRGGESDRDERFCEHLCQTLNVPFHRVHFDTTAFASLHRISIEMAARQLRYAHFEALRLSLHATEIAVAHHLNDSVETFLLNLLNNTGLHGLTGIKPRNGFVVRPLLCVTRDEITDYISSLGQDYVTDSTNLVPDFKRNKIRLQLLPLCAQVNEAAVSNIASCISRLQDVERIFDKAAAESVESSKISVGDPEMSLVLDLNVLSRSVAVETYLFEAIRGYGFNGTQVGEMVHCMDGSGKTWQSGSHEALIDRGRLFIAPLSVFDHRSLKIPLEGTYVWKENAQTGHKCLFRVSSCDREKTVVSHDPNCCTLDASKVTFPLTVRHAVRGDAFRPFGMKGRKLVSDFLTDRKATLFDKRRQLVVCQSDGDIVWLVGLRPDDRFKITPSTQTVLTISFGNR